MDQMQTLYFVGSALALALFGSAVGFMVSRGFDRRHPHLTKKSLLKRGAP